MNPEGVSWQEVDNEGRECTQISLGPSCLLWAVTWDGEVMVRLGITRDNPIGQGTSQKFLFLVESQNIQMY